MIAFGASARAVVVCLCVAACKVAGVPPSDQTAALQALIDRATAAGGTGEVLLPASGTDLHINAALNLSRGGVRVVGPRAGITRIVQLNASQPVFVAAGRRDSNNHTVFCKDIVIANLHFGCNACHAGAVLFASAVANVALENNTVEDLGLLTMGTPYPVNSWDKTHDPAATAGLVSSSQLSQNITVRGNLLRGNGSGAIGVSVSWADGVRVTNNVVRGYAHGVNWWGGDANPSRGGNPANPRWARNVDIENNTVTQSAGGGIWGSMGQNVIARWNHVDGCGDVCLDAEGSNQVTFEYNNAANSANGVLAVFFNSQDVRFIRNTCVQNGRMNPAWSSFLRQCNPTLVGAASRINVTIAHNRFVYSNHSGFGVLGKDTGMM